MLRRDAPREVLADLVKQCDVFLHNFSPSAVKAFRLGYEDVRALREDVIYTGISCYGATGPYAMRSGFDQIAQVMSGACALTGYAHEPPMRSAVPWVDYSTGCSGRSASCSRFATATRRGRGRKWTARSSRPR